MSKKYYPHWVAVTFPNNKAREVINWLHDQGLVLHETVKFGQGKFTDSHVSWQVGFKDANDALMFKLAWG